MREGVVYFFFKVTFRLGLMFARFNRDIKKNYLTNKNPLRSIFRHLDQSKNYSFGEGGDGKERGHI